jgi:hypothetical protein
VAIILDDRARAMVDRRRSRGRDARIYLHLDRGSIRVGVPWIMVVGWAPHRWPSQPLVLQHAGDVEIYLDPRVARYTHWRNLTIFGARLGPWQWLAIADPFAFERMHQWELTHPDSPLPPTGAESPSEVYEENEEWLPDAS